MRWAVVMGNSLCRDDRGATSLEYMIVVGAIADLVGSRLVFRTKEDLYQTFDELRRQLDEPGGVTLVDYKDRFLEPERSGYRDIQLIVQMSNGHVGELQLQLSNMAKAGKYEHTLYEARRTIRKDIKKRGGEATPEESVLMRALLAESRHINEAAHAKDMRTGRRRFFSKGTGSEAESAVGAP